MPFSRGRVYINGLEGFRSYAKERLIKHHGISPARFPLYLKEQEFRNNHREKDINPILVKYLMLATVLLVSINIANIGLTFFLNDYIRAKYLVILLVLLAISSSHISFLIKSRQE